MKLKICLILIMILVFESCTTTKQLFKKNKYDSSLRKHGIWKLYYKGNLISKKEVYKHGRPRGKWKHYLPDSKLYMIERYRKNGTFVKQKTFHPNGELSRKGNALETTDSIQFWYRWHGDQYFYDTLGNLERKEFYYQGEFVRKEIIVKKNKNFIQLK